jgi:G:T-mismatch repair DNA endonuclease (very short patch repair protein)
MDTRDRENQQKLAERGWQVLALWECEIRSHEKVVERPSQFLGGSKAKVS